MRLLPLRSGIKKLIFCWAQNNYIHIRNFSKLVWLMSIQYYVHALIWSERVSSQCTRSLYRVKKNKIVDLTIRLGDTHLISPNTLVLLAFDCVRILFLYFRLAVEFQFLLFGLKSKCMCWNLQNILVHFDEVVSFVQYFFLF